MEFQFKYLALFCLFSVIDNFTWFWTGSLHKNVQLMLEFFKAPFLVLHYFYYTLMTLLMLSAILLTILDKDTTLYSKCEQSSDFWEQHELASELESDLQDTVDWCRKWFADLNAGKTQLASFDWCNNKVLLMCKWMGMFLRKQHLLYYLYIGKIASNKNWNLNSFYEISFFRGCSVTLYIMQPWVEYCFKG